jgi:pyruvate-formate lyase-activating enzyme
VSTWVAKSALQGPSCQRPLDGSIEGASPTGAVTWRHLGAAAAQHLGHPVAEIAGVDHQRPLAGLHEVRRRHLHRERCRSPAHDERLALAEASHTARMRSRQVPKASIRPGAVCDGGGAAAASRTAGDTSTGPGIINRSRSAMAEESIAQPGSLVLAHSRVYDRRMSILRSPLRILNRSVRSPRIPRPLPREAGDDSPPMVCRMIFDEVCVLANGDVVCSCGDPAGLRVYGNVHRDRLADVYDGAMYRQMRRWQLASRPDSWCPVTGQDCGGRVSRATPMDGETGRTVKMLQLEPVGACNLSCPACPATHFEIDRAYKRDRTGILPMATMLDVVDQLPDLEKLLFYNFGEPFLHKDAIPFLREVRRRRPEVEIHTSTNGLAFTPAKIEALAGERLLDRVVFSIDGARAETYAQYRVGGDLERALGSLEAFLEALEAAGHRQRVTVLWQYILFEWNDGDEEITEARRRAAALGVPIKWVATHTEGRSRRFTPGSAELARLTGERGVYESLTCDLRAADLWRHDGAARGRYGARLAAAEPRIEAPAGSRVAFEVELTNASGAVWRRGEVRLGLRLRSASGRLLRELPGLPLPVESLAPGEETRVYTDLALPDEAVAHQLLVDVVEPDVCWFSERGSQPLLLTLEPVAAPAREWSWDEATAAAFDLLLDEPPGEGACEYWRDQLRSGQPLEVWLDEIWRASGASGVPPARRRRALWDRLRRSCGGFPRLTRSASTSAAP